MAVWLGVTNKSLRMTSPITSGSTALTGGGPLCMQMPEAHDLPACGDTKLN